jgi:signal transduction histidine kinase
VITRRELAGATAYTAASLAILFLQPVSGDAGITRHADLLAVALVLASTLPLAWRRAAPVTVALVVGPVAVFGQLHGYAMTTEGVGALFALGSAAYLTDRVRTIALGAYGVVVLLVGSIAIGGPLLTLGVLVNNLISPVLAVLVGDVMRQRRVYAERLRELSDADRERAVAEERVRIAREVHDVVGHRLAGITLQARGCKRRIETDPVRAAEALDEIDKLAAQALAETRAAVGLIGDPGELAPTEPLAST